MLNSAVSLDDAEVAIAAVLAGADVVRSMYGRRLARIDKGAGDFATTADVAAERAILEVIRATRPGDAVLGEEGGQRGAAESARQWLVDPLCGTLNYAVGSMLVAVNVALRGGPAAVADPFTGEVFYTDGTTAWLRRAEAAGVAEVARAAKVIEAAGAAKAEEAEAAGAAGVAQEARAAEAMGAAGAVEEAGVAEAAEARLEPTPASGLVDVNLDPPFPSAPGIRAVDLLANPGFAERFRPRVVSTTLALAWVAAGRRAAYVSDGGDLSGSVHFAAGIALCQAAGCTLTGIDGAPLGPRGRGIVAAADADTHELLMSIIRAPR